MNSAPREFVFSAEPEPHRARTKAILRTHPEIRGLIGKNPWTAFWLLALVAGQFGLMVLATRVPWWGMLLVAYIGGAFFVHSLYVMIHECAHNLIFRRTWANSIAGIVANLPSVVPGAASFQKFHLLHHSFQGVYELDADLPSRWEIRLVRGSRIGKALWLLLFPVVEAFRPLRLEGAGFFNRWVVINIVVQFAADAAIVWLFGWGALLYLTASMFFALGLHPLGARWIQRHFLAHGTLQETTSYYGPVNRIAFNVGFHNEHHDFPSVPWHRLPEIRRTAPEFYESLAAHTSWTRLLFRFLLDPRLSLHSRVARLNRADAPEPETVEVAPASSGPAPTA